jgi:hypothetical protein
MERDAEREAGLDRVVLRVDLVARERHPGLEAQRVPRSEADRRTPFGAPTSAIAFHTRSASFRGT